MKNIIGQVIVPGLYKKYTGDSFNLTNLELYIVQEQQGKLIAFNGDGNPFQIKDPGFYDRRRNHINQEALDCFDLILVDTKNYNFLKTNITKSQKRNSKLLQMLNKANLSEGAKGLNSSDSVEFL